MTGGLLSLPLVLAAATLDVDCGNALHLHRNREDPVAVILRDERARTWRGRLVATDFFGAARTARVDRAAAAGEAVRVELPAPRRYGAWIVEARMDEGERPPPTRFAVVPERSPASADTFAMGCQIQLPSYTPEDRRLCVAAARAMGARVVRLNFCSFRTVCAHGPIPDFSGADEIMALLEPMNVKVCANIYGTPKWARQLQESAPAHEPWHACYRPPREGLFRDFCRALAAHYGTKIAWYEIGNEWDLLPPETLSLEDGVRVMREAYEGLRAGCPAARVIPNGWAVATGTSLAQARPAFQEDFMTQAKGFYDAHTIHIHGPYAHYVSELQKFFAWRKERGIDAPWFPDETALTCVNGQERAAARDVWRKILYGWAHGAIAHSWYQLRASGDNPKSHGDNYGLMTRRFYPRYTYAAFAALTHLLSGATFAGAYCDTPTRQILRFRTERDGVAEIVVVGFDTQRPNGAEVVPFTTDAAKILAYDLMGNACTVAAPELSLTETPAALRFVGASFAKTSRAAATGGAVSTNAPQRDSAFLSARPIRLDPAFRLRLTATFEHEGGFLPRLHTAGAKVLSMRLNGKSVTDLAAAKVGENQLELEVCGESFTAEVEESGKTTAATPGSFAVEPIGGTPPTASFREGAAERPDETAFAPFAAQFDAVEARARQYFPTNALAYERTLNRLVMARRCLDFAKRHLAKRTPDGDGFAVLALEDLKAFVTGFDEEFACWKASPAARSPQSPLPTFTASNPDQLYEALAKVKALNGSPALVELGAGVFHFGRVWHSGYDLDVPETKRSAQFPLFGLTNVLIQGKGPARTRIVFDHYDATGLCLVKCRNVTVRGLELDWNETPFSEGVIRAFDREKGTVDVSAKSGALRPDDPRFARGNRRLVCAWYDREGHVIERPFLFVRGPAENVSEGLYRLRLDLDAKTLGSVSIEAGQTLAVPDREGFLTAGCVHSDFCTFEDVTIRSARSSAFSSTHTRQEAVWKCRILPKDGFRLSTNADGFYCSRGSYIAHCVFRGMNDDGTNPHGTCAKIVERLDARTLRLANVSPMRAGELCQFVRSPSGQTIQLNRLVSQVREGSVLRVAFARDLPDDLAVGGHDSLFTPTSDGTGFCAVDNCFSEIRNNAMVVQCPHALIANNRADHVLKGLHVCGLVYGGWGEGTAPHDVLVRGNAFRDVRIGLSAGALMHTGVATCAPIQGVDVVGNTVERAAEKAGEFRNVTGVTFRDNRFEEAPLPLEFVRSAGVSVP